MLALRAIVAADGQHPVPLSREHASASASSTRRSLPDVGEFAHTQFITAMLTVAALSRPPAARVPRRPRLLERAAAGCGRCRVWVSDSGSEMGAARLGQMPSGAAKPLPAALPDLR